MNDAPLRCDRRGVKRLVPWAVVAGAVLGGCQHDEADRAATCEGADRASYRTPGRALAGDVDADGVTDRVTLGVDRARPARCRHLLVVELAGGATATANVPPLDWPGTDPRLLLLAGIDGRPGLEPVVAMTSIAAVYRPGAVFTLRRGKLLPLRLERAPVPRLFPFSDEFPAGVDCAERPGTIVVTWSRIAPGGDRFWDLRRRFYRADGTRFVFVRAERFLVAVGPDAPRRWPEVRGTPFLRCPGRVG